MRCVLKRRRRLWVDPAAAGCSGYCDDAAVKTTEALQVLYGEVSTFRGCVRGLQTNKDTDRLDRQIGSL